MSSAAVTRPPRSDDLVTYREMVEYVTETVEPIRTRQQGHDDWHRGQLVAANRQMMASIFAGLGAIVAAASAIAAALITHMH